MALKVAVLSSAAIISGWGNISIVESSDADL